MEVSHENAKAFAKEFVIHSLFNSLPTNCRHQAALEECKIAFSRRKLTDPKLITYGLKYLTSRRFRTFRKRSLATLATIDEICTRGIV